MTARITTNYQDRTTDSLDVPEWAARYRRCLLAWSIHAFNLKVVDNKVVMCGKVNGVARNVDICENEPGQTFGVATSSGKHPLYTVDDVRALSDDEIRKFPG